MTDKELEKLFRAKLKDRSFEFNADNWKAMSAILESDQNGMPDEGLDNLFRSKLEHRKFDFNPANWTAMETMLEGTPDDGLDNLFRSKLEHRKFDFNPANWSAMEAMLDGTRRIRFYWYAAALILGFGWGAFGLMQLNRGTQTPHSQEAYPLQEVSVTIPENVANEGDIAASDQTTAEPQGSAPVQVQGSSDIASISTPGNSGPDAFVNSALPVEPIADDIQDPVDPVIPVDDSETGTALAYFSESMTNLDAKFAMPDYQIEMVTLDIIDPHFEAKALKKFWDKHEFYLTAGFNSMRAHNAGASFGTGYAVGIGYRYRLDDIWSFNTGLNYNYQDQMGILQRTDSVFFGFGNERIEVINDFRSIHYLEIPFNVSYALNGKHEIDLGFYAAYNMSVTKDVMVRESNFKDGTTESLTSHSGDDNDIRKTDFGITAGYLYQLSPNVSAGLRMRYGLQDITRDSHATLLDSHRNIGARVILRYRLF